jgi:hypothetical protein
VQDQRVVLSAGDVDHHQVRERLVRPWLRGPVRQAPGMVGREGSNDLPGVAASPGVASRDLQPVEDGRAPGVPHGTDGEPVDDLVGRRGGLAIRSRGWS